LPDRNSKASEPKNKGRIIFDATACPKDIAYPTDLDLLSNARKKPEELIDVLYSPALHEKKPRTYRKIARKLYLKTSQKKNKSRKQIPNNVETTNFQVGYHYPNTKSRYFGETKHQMWVNIRCLWVNSVRILKYIKQLCQRTMFFAKFVLKSFFFDCQRGNSELYFAIKSILTAILPNNLSRSENTRFSRC